MIPDLIKKMHSRISIYVHIKSVTNVRTIAEVMNWSEIYKRMLGEVHKILKLYLSSDHTVE